MKNRYMLKIENLLEKGVKIPNPDSIEIGDEVNIDKISGNGVVIHAGCKIFGSSTLVCQGTKLGYEGPVTIENCQIGPNVNLRGGFIKEAVFLKNTNIGFGSHVREGTILEEESSIAHTVGLKQTILFPFVTLGSLINFCDCLMSGGTGRNDHSEVGSSYIHFNYTPNQDKATPSLIGDVPKGVMLNQKPIFLGGQGGIVGPCRLAFGTLIAAGTIFRKDELRPGRLIFGGEKISGNIRFNKGVYSGIKRTIINNIIYLSNLMALMQWYIHVRSIFISDDFPQPLFDGLKEKLNMAIDERIIRLKGLRDNMPDSKPSSVVLGHMNEFYARWPELENSFNDLRARTGDKGIRDLFLEKVYTGVKKSGKDYLTVIKGLETGHSESGTEWLQGIIDEIMTETYRIIPSFCASVS